MPVSSPVPMYCFGFLRLAIVTPPLLSRSVKRLKNGSGKGLCPPSSKMDCRPQRPLICEAQYGRCRNPFQRRIIALLEECGKECGLVSISVAVGVGFCWPFIQGNGEGGGRLFVNDNVFITHNIRPEDFFRLIFPLFRASPEKAGVGGSIPSLATIHLQ